MEIELDNARPENWNRFTRSCSYVEGEDQAEWDDRLEAFMLNAARRLALHLDTVEVESDTTALRVLHGGGYGELKIETNYGSKLAFGIGLRHLGAVRYGPEVNDALARRAKNVPTKYGDFITSASRNYRKPDELLAELALVDMLTSKTARMFPGAEQLMGLSSAKTPERVIEMHSPRWRLKQAISDVSHLLAGMIPLTEHVHALKSVLPKWQEVMEEVAYMLRQPDQIGDVREHLIRYLASVPWDEDHSNADFDSEQIPEKIQTGAMLIERYEEIVQQALESSGTSTPEYLAWDERHAVLKIKDSPATTALRDALMDERIEREHGHMSGIMTQPQRMLSDFRPMGRRMTLEDLPDTMMVGLVDCSGSMASSGRWERAVTIHDGVMKALHDIGIPAISAAYDQAGMRRDRIRPINAPGRKPISLSVVSPEGGTGDLGAVNWAAERLDEAGKKGRVVFIISDNEGPSDPRLMKKALKMLGASVVHIDLVGRAGSQYGVEPIVLKSGQTPDWKRIGRELKKALKLEV